MLFLQSQMWKSKSYVLGKEAGNSLLFLKGKIMGKDTIAGIASGMGGGIGVIRISGEDALKVIGEIFRCKNNIVSGKINPLADWDEDYFYHQNSHTIHYGFIVNDDGNVLDEVMVLVMKNPKSYTCEDVIEIDSHGGPFLVQKILELILKHNVRLAEPGEFTKRAFLNGRIDLSQAEAVMNMISSKNDFALDSAINQLEGRVSQFIQTLRDKLLYQMGYIESALDDPEHYSLDGFSESLYSVVSEIDQELTSLLNRFEQGRLKSEGINTVIIGKPNAGKSSLMNLLMDEERAIVTNIAGTTRDILEETVHLGNIILNLVDTAGIHETEDLVESLGVEKAKECIMGADFIIYVVDVNDEFSDADQQIIDLIQGKKGIILFNKSDLDIKINFDLYKDALGWDYLSFSSTKGNGLTELEEYITSKYLQGDITYNDQIYITNVRHKDAVYSAHESLVQVLQAIDDGMTEDIFMVDLMDAYRSLGLINGETATEDLVNKIFKEFCMGK